MKVVQKEATVEDSQSNYNSCPTYPAKGEIFDGFSSLAAYMCEHSACVLDGYIGVDWDLLVKELQVAFQELGKKAIFLSVEEAMLAEDIVESKVAPFLGGDDPLFGFKTSLALADFFEDKKLEAIREQAVDGMKIVYGCGAALCRLDAPIVYVDLPKNILQKRMRSGGGVYNLGANSLLDNKQTYKRFYFVDWVVLNQHKKAILPQVEVMVDQQQTDNITWMLGKDLRHTLQEMASAYFRVKPWFEPGVWGGQWLKEHIKELDQSVDNYAWSFEMIVPENGLTLANKGHKLEVSFDQLLFQEGNRVLGKAHRRFGDEFPIRFDFLDTFEGGNLSIQCHPSTSYIKEHFGEQFTQDETYYIVDCEEDAEVYLGFQDDIDPPNFKAALERSFEAKETLDIEQYVQKFPAKKHELYLIPNGTVHASGKNNLVLEISATPYIFTFKMYDWLRPDLDGQPRPLNIDRAFDNLDFSRKGDVVSETLIAKPAVKRIDEQSSVVHLPTHPVHFYDVYRYDFDKEVAVETDGQCHVLMLVEGEAIELTTRNGHRAVFNHIETFAVPAAAESYKLRNLGNKQAKVVVAFVKNEALI